MAMAIKKPKWLREYIEMRSIELVNSNGMEVKLVNWGARIASILVPIDDQLIEMLVTPEDNTLFLDDPFYLGATCGPVCNRISNATFELNGKNFKLSQNDGENCLHGGENNISLRSWEVVEISNDAVAFKLSLAHLEDGFPGNRELYVRYQLSSENELKIELEAVSDKDTPINMTNHAYFNLGEDNINNLMFKINTKEFVERDYCGIPTGRLINTSKTGFSLTNWLNVRDFICNSHYKQILLEEGVDHCFVLDGADEISAALMSENSGVKLFIETNQPSIQIYTGKYLSEPFNSYQGICFECQGYTDALNHSHFPSVILNKNEKYSKYISYQFVV